MSIKMIVSDVDGTLLDHEGKCHERTRAAIHRAVKEGVVVTLGTGRGFATANPLHKELGMTGPIITLNGAVIKDPFITYQSHLVADDAIGQALDFGEEIDVITYFFVADQIYGHLASRKRFESMMKGLDAFKEELSYFHWIDSRTDLMNQVTGRTNKIVFVDVDVKAFQPSEKMRSARGLLAERMKGGQFCEDVDVTSSYFNNMELMPKGVNKGTGVAELAEALGFVPSEVMCIGDNENDLDMFAYAGESYAMDNASDLVKAAAKHITLSVNDGGVGVAIEEILGNNRHGPESGA